MVSDTIAMQQKINALGLGAGWNWNKGSWWMVADSEFDVRVFTQRLLSLGARFVAITASQREDREMRLDYQWDLNGQLLSMTTATADNAIASIVDLSPAADWVERETHEYFAVEFTGRGVIPPLMMRAGDTVGINLRKEDAQ